MGKPLAIKLPLSHYVDYAQECKGASGMEWPVQRQRELDQNGAGSLGSHQHLRGVLASVSHAAAQPTFRATFLSAAATMRARP